MKVEVDIDELVALREAVERLEERLDATESDGRVENHYHYHYAQQPAPPSYPYTWPYTWWCSAPIQQLSSADTLGAITVTC